MKYVIRFWFDFGGFCLWGMNGEAQDKYGYSINVNELNLSEPLKSEIINLQEKYGTYLDLTNPLAPSTWSNEEKENFLNQSRVVFDDMQRELGPNYELIFDVEKNIDN